MTLGSPGQDYGEPSYWDNRYRQDPGPFDWYQKYSTISPLLDLYLKRDHRVLHVGCGNSVLGEDMVKNGYQDVINIDISSVVIEAMQNKFHNQPAYKYIQMDVRDMSSLEAGSFDAVIDKGTLDSLMCGSNAQQNATRMLEEVGRILKDKGVYILITYGDPSYRLYLLRDLHMWTINLHVIDRIEKQSDKPLWELIRPVPLDEDGSYNSRLLGPNVEIHYIYICTKEESLHRQKPASAKN